MRIEPSVDKFFKYFREDTKERDRPIVRSIKAVTRFKNGYNFGNLKFGWYCTGDEGLVKDVG